MPTSLVLRFRDLVAETISEHCNVIQKYEYVWWGWWNKPDEKIPRNTFAQFQEVIESEGHLWIYLVDSGKQLLYKALLKEIDISNTEKGRACREPMKTPEYYRTAEYKAWFRITQIKLVHPDEIRKWSYDEIDNFLDDAGSKRFQNKRVFNIQEMLNRHHRTIYFIKPYEQLQHADHLLELQPTLETANFHKNPIITRSSYILHLSDLHFGNGNHWFALQDDDVRRKRLSTLIINDLKQEYGDTPPAAVVISGDLTWQGKPEEFRLACDFIQRLKSVYDLDARHFVCLPGNHDIQWSNQEENKYDRTKPVSKPQEHAEKNYRDFYKETFGLVPTVFLSMGRRYILGNYVPVDIIGLNSSRLEQKYFAGYGYVSLEQLDDAFKAMDWQTTKHKVQYRMLVLHHHVIPVTPKEEITSYDRIYSLTLDAGQLIYAALGHNVDLIAHGHMHQPFASSVSRASKSWKHPSSSLAVHGAGSSGVIREHLGDIGKNSYSVYDFDADGVTVTIRSLSENIEGFEKDWQFRLIRNPDGGLNIGKLQESGK